MYHVQNKEISALRNGLLLTIYTGEMVSAGKSSINMGNMDMRISHTYNGAIFFNENKTQRALKIQFR